MESYSNFPLPEQPSLSPAPETISAEKKRGITNFVDRLYLVMATKINDGVPPLTQLPEGCIEPERRLYDIQIGGNEQFTNRTQAALELLRRNAPDHYTFVRHNVGIISQVERASGILVREPIPVYLASKRNLAGWYGSKRYASDIVHEAWHVHFYYQWLKGHPEAKDDFELFKTWLKGTIEQQEKECLTVQYGTLVRLKTSPGDLIDVKTVFNSRYWEVPMEQRWW